MGIIALVRADFLKQRHTSYWGIHTVIPIAGAILFVFYFLLYQNVDELKKLRLLLELTAMVFPLLISVIVGLNITQEERASHFQSLLAARSPENTAGKVCRPVSVRHLFLGATFCIICDWGRNEPDRDYPVGAIDTIRAGAGNGQFRNICATPAP